MKKLCLLFLCILCLISASCSIRDGGITMEKFEQYASAYKDKIQTIDETLVINETSHSAQNGDYIKVYSIETLDKGCFGVTLTVFSANKAKLLIEFTNAEDAWTADNVAVFSHLISELSNTNLKSTQINVAIDDMRSSDSYTFNKNACLFWDDYHYTLYYEEKLSIDMNT